MSGEKEGLFLSYIFNEFNHSFHCFDRRRTAGKPFRIAMGPQGQSILLVMFYEALKSEVLKTVQK